MTFRARAFVRWVRSRREVGPEVTTQVREVLLRLNLPESGLLTKGTGDPAALQLRGARHALDRTRARPRLLRWGRRQDPRMIVNKLQCYNLCNLDFTRATSRINQRVRAAILTSTSRYRARLWPRRRSDPADLRTGAVRNLNFPVYKSVIYSKNFNFSPSIPGPQPALRASQARNPAQSHRFQHPPDRLALTGGMTWTLR